MYRRFFKRLTDLLMSLCILVFLMPVWLVIALCIRVDSPGSSLFMQDRVGLCGRKFRMLKFRTMVREAYKFGAGYYFDGEDDARITRLGRILRRTSLDEVPQLLNVIVGDMSLIGPRPMLPYQCEHLSSEQRRRLLVRPGITGLAQVTGRNMIPWSERIRMDIDYVDRLSLKMDLTILLETVRTTFRGRGVDYSGTPSDIEDFIYSKEALSGEHKRAVGDP